MENSCFSNGGGLNYRAHHTEKTLQIHREYNNILKSKKININGQDLTVASLTAASRNMSYVKVFLDPSCRQGVDESVACLQKHIDDSTEVIYGVNTGFGASADEWTHNEKSNEESLLNHLNAVTRSNPLSSDISSGTILARMNSNIRGYSGISWAILEKMSRLFNKGVIPVFPTRGSVTASGDLIPLSYLASLIAGKPFSLAWQNGDVVNGLTALESVDEQPIKLSNKDGLAIVNGTSVAATLAAFVTHDSHYLFMLSEACTALTVAALNGTKESFHENIHKSRPHPGQIDVAHNLRHLLKGCNFCTTKWDEMGANKLRQDRYSTRAAAQWLGPHVETLTNVTDTIEIELNSVTDNPLVTNNEILHGANFMGTSISQAMDHLRLSLQAVGRLAFAQFTKLINKYYNNGLPPNLTTDDPAIEYGLKGVDIAMASFMSELQFLSNPVTNCMNSAECDNQDLNSLGLISARYTSVALEIVRQMLASHLYALCTAVDLRSVESLFISQVQKSEEIIKLNDIHQPPVPKKPKVSSKLLSQEVRQKGVFHVIWSEEGLISGSSESGSDFRKLNEICANFRSKKFIKDAVELTTVGLGNTQPLHAFVRDSLDVRFSDNHDHSAHIEKIDQAIKSGHINSVLCGLYVQDDD